MSAPIKLRIVQSPDLFAIGAVHIAKGDSQSATICGTIHAGTIFEKTTDCTVTCKACMALSQRKATT